MLRLLCQWLMAIPVLPALGGWLTNYRKASSWLCSPKCVALNVSDTWYCFVNRQDRRNVLVARDMDGRFLGFFVRLSDKE